MTSKKELAWQAWVEAWSQAKDVENVQDITKRVARNRFEQWWDNNYANELPDEIDDSVHYERRAEAAEEIQKIIETL